MPPLISPDVRPVNSTSYSDVAGLDLGLQRLPGEDNHAFLDRLFRASLTTRDHTYQGTVNEIALELGLQVRTGISISSTDPNAAITADASGVHLGGITSPLFVIQPDHVWSWRMLSDIVGDINAAPGFSATLISPDAPALQICKQSNVYTVLAESISGAVAQLKFDGLVPSTLSFNLPVPAYTVSGSKLTFTSAVPDGCLATYQYRVLPYPLVCSDVSVIGLTENIASAVVANGVIAYQVREALQEVMRKDRSYWAR